MHELLTTPDTPEKAIALQEKWQQIVYPFQNQPNIIHDDTEIKTIVGLDISFPADFSLTWGIGCAVVWDYRKNCEINHIIKKAEINFPYITGLLAFRECSLLAELIHEISIPIDVLLCDGHGYWHPRHLGEAVQLGIALNLPSIGIAKQPLRPIEQNWKQIPRQKGNSLDIFDKIPFNSLQCENVAKAIILSENCSPAFLSTGYRMDMKAAITIALNTTKSHRQPEPLYLAHRYSHDALEK